jgi:hypothetical protein
MLVNWVMRPSQQGQEGCLCCSRKGETKTTPSGCEGAFSVSSVKSGFYSIGSAITGLAAEDPEGNIPPGDYQIQLSTNRYGF